MSKNKDLHISWPLPDTVAWLTHRQHAFCSSTDALHDWQTETCSAQYVIGLAEMRLAQTMTNNALHCPGFLIIQPFATFSHHSTIRTYHISLAIATRDVMKFKFEFYNVQTSNVFNRFEIRRTFKCRVVECEFVENSSFYDWFLMHSKKSTAARERRQSFL